ncbi:MAG TPA: NAD(P)/FAD-dependent oxidoreductase [Flavipsychrobacter sp.]|jgi:geranylgeranyl reductase family protein|nr:NAD(P)/FAD-dependent oxidoreductase [Flavipsychrobacter sp.]
MQLNAIHTPVVIVGAGPAGAGTSIYLSKAGIPHVILEKETFPRDKVCGDAISGKSAFVLRKANPEWLLEVFQQPEKYTPSRGIIFVAPNGKPLRIPYNNDLRPGEKGAGFTSPRLVFDNFLFQKIDNNYASVFQNATITAIERNEDGIRVLFTKDGEPFEVLADLIVGADGDKGIVRRKLLVSNASPKAYTVGLRAYYEGVTIDPDQYIELHFLPEVLPGYFWIFPLPNGMANVGVGVLSERIRDKKINLREQMLKAIQENPTISSRFKNATLKGKIQGWGLPMGMEKLPVSGDRFLLTGDAASLIDPFSGEGIGNALYSGMLAAGAIEKAMEAKRFDAAFLKEAYDDVLYNRLGDELRISAFLQRLCRYPWLFNVIVNKAYRSPSLKDTISCMFTDIDLREKLRKPSFYAKILFNR